MRERSHGRRLRCMTDSIWHDSHRHRMCPLWPIYRAIHHCQWVLMDRGVNADLLDSHPVTEWLGQNTPQSTETEKPMKQRNYVLTRDIRIRHSPSVGRDYFHYFAVCLFIYLFVCLFICLHNISFKREVIACDILHWVKQSAHVE